MKEADALLQSAAAVADLLPQDSKPHAKYKLGVYYFPGWIDGVVASRLDPWGKLSGYPGRIPMQGKYQEGVAYNAEYQLNQMYAAGFDFAVVNWYWSGGVEYLNQAVGAFKSVIGKTPMQYCLTWDNTIDNSVYPRTVAEWGQIVAKWIDHFRSPAYYTVGGKPVVFIFSPDQFRNRANALYPAAAAAESATLQLINAANQAAIAAGLPGIYFVAAMTAQSWWVGAGKYLERNGYAAQSGYMHHNELTDRSSTPGPLATSYAQLDGIYRSIWAWNGANSTLPYWPPMVSGYDRRPWGGSTPPEHDNCEPETEEFMAHLQAAKDALDSNQRMVSTAVLYAWNEFGEGGYIEPTCGRMWSFVNCVKRIFDR